MVLYVLVLSSIYSHAQMWGSIDSLRIIPSNPLTFDTVKIISYTHFPVSYCFQINSTITSNGFNLIIDSYHGLGNLHAFCYSTDTLTLSYSFDAGNYCVIYNLWDTVSILDVDTICFSILLNAIPADNQNITSSIVPNPIADYAILTLSDYESYSNYQFEILDCNGKLILLEPINNKKFIFFRNQIPSGIYVYLIRKEGIIVERKKIVLN